MRRGSLPTPRATSEKREARQEEERPERKRHVASRHVIDATARPTTARGEELLLRRKGRAGPKYAVGPAAVIDATLKIRWADRGQTRIVDAEAIDASLTWHARDDATRIGRTRRRTVGGDDADEVLLAGIAHAGIVGDTQALDAALPRRTGLPGAGRLARPRDAHLSRCAGDLRTGVILTRVGNAHLTLRATLAHAGVVTTDPRRRLTALVSLARHAGTFLDTHAIDAALRVLACHARADLRDTVAVLTMAPARTGELPRTTRQQTLPLNASGAPGARRVLIDLAIAVIIFTIADLFARQRASLTDEHATNAACRPRFALAHVLPARLPLTFDVVIDDGVTIVILAVTKFRRASLAPLANQRTSLTSPHAGRALARVRPANQPLLREKFVGLTIAVVVFAVTDLPLRADPPGTAQRPARVRMLARDRPLLALAHIRATRRPSTRDPVIGQVIAVIVETITDLCLRAPRAHADQRPGDAEVRARVTHPHARSADRPRIHGMIVGDTVAVVIVPIANLRARALRALTNERAFDTDRMARLAYAHVRTTERRGDTVVDVPIAVVVLAVTDLRRPLQTTNATDRAIHALTRPWGTLADARAADPTKARDPIVDLAIAVIVFSVARLGDWPESAHTDLLALAVTSRHAAMTFARVRSTGLAHDIVYRAIAVIVSAIADLRRFPRTRRAGVMDRTRRVVHAVIQDALVGLAVAVVVFSIADLSPWPNSAAAAPPVAVRTEATSELTDTDTDPRRHITAAHVSNPRRARKARLNEAVDEGVAVVVDAIAELRCRPRAPLTDDVSIHARRNPSLAGADIRTTWHRTVVLIDQAVAVVVLPVANLCLGNAGGAALVDGAIAVVVETVVTNLSARSWSARRHAARAP